MTKPYTFTQYFQLHFAISTTNSDSRCCKRAKGWENAADEFRLPEAVEPRSLSRQYLMTTTVECLQQKQGTVKDVSLRLPTCELPRTCFAWRGPLNASNMWACCEGRFSAVHRRHTTSSSTKKEYRLLPLSQVPKLRLRHLFCCGQRALHQIKHGSDIQLRQCSLLCLRNSRHCCQQNETDRTMLCIYFQTHRFCKRCTAIRDSGNAF